MSAAVTEHGEHEAREVHEAPLHARSFKLRFAAQRELGRSYVSAVKPLTLRECGAISVVLWDSPTYLKSMHNLIPPVLF